MNVIKRMYNFQKSRFNLIHSKTPFHCKYQIQLKANSFYWLHCKRNIYTLARTSQQNLIKMNFHVTFLNNIALKIVANSCWFSHDVTKIQTTKLSILPRFYFHDVLEQLKTNFHTNFPFKRVLGFVIEYTWISKLLRDAAFTWRPIELSHRLKKMTYFRNFPT